MSRSANAKNPPVAKMHRIRNPNADAPVQIAPADQKVADPTQTKAFEQTPPHA